MIESDPDNVECEAGYLATPPTDNAALVDDIDLQCWAAFKCHALPSAIARLIAERVNERAAIASREAPPAVTVKQAVKRLPVVWQTDPDDAYGVNTRALVSRDDVLRALGGSN